MSAKGGSSASAWNREREYHKGPVTLRRGQVPGSTTDQRLLDSHGGTDWVHTDPWRVLRIQAEFVEGFGALAEIGPAVSVFGSARTKPDHPTYALGVRVGAALVEAGYAVITGGGPGAMEAANKGAVAAGGYWGGLLDWLRSSALEHGTISPADLDLVTITDDVDVAVRTIVRADRGPQREEPTTHAGPEVGELR